MRKKLLPMEAFNHVVRDMEIPDLDGKCTHAEIADHFACLVVRGTLVKIGVDFIKADELAGNHGGPAQIRLIHCLRVLGITAR